MGVKNLLQTLKDSITSGYHIGNLSGKLVAVDVSGWIYKAICDQKYGLEQSIMQKVKLLEYYNVRVLLVFDGARTEAKRAEKERREEQTSKRKRELEQRYQQCSKKRKTESGAVGVNPEFSEAQQSSETPNSSEDEPEVVDKGNGQIPFNRDDIQGNLKKWCRLHGIGFLQAPFEADHQIAYLLREKLVAAAITDDSDFVVHGCNKILFKLKGTTGDFYEKKDFQKSWGSEYDENKFRKVCITVDSDYFKGGLKDFGLVKAKEMYNKFRNCPQITLAKLKKCIKKNYPKVIFPADFDEKYHKAERTFLYMPVYNPRNKELIPLNDYPPGIIPADVDFAGEEEKAYKYHCNPPQLVSKASRTMTWKREPKTKFYCRDCTDNFNNWQELLKHRRKNHPYLCSKCPRIFGRRDMCIDHELRHGEKRTIICPVCHKMFWTKYDMMCHRRKQHTTTMYHCDICGKGYRGKYALNEHKISHKKERNIKCNVPGCGKTFKFMRCLTMHTKVVHDEKKIFCDTCGKAFATKQHLNSHKRTAQKREGKEFLCGLCLCHPGFDHERSKLRHMAKEHSSFNVNQFPKTRRRVVHHEKRFFCRNCKKGFSCKRNLTNHLLVAAKAWSSPYRCMACRCHQGFQTLKGWLKHVKREHECYVKLTRIDAM